MALLDRLAISALPLVPTPVMRRLAGRYIAGESLGEAIDRLTALRAQGHPGIIDILGEDVRDERDARAVADAYKETADAVAAARLDAYVSVKPTHVGLEIGEDLAFSLYDSIAKRCAERGLRMRVEMEDHRTTDGTLRVFERLRAVHRNVGIVLQSRLFRTMDDIARLAPGPLDVRLVKGIYLEPASIAHVDPEPIRESFVRCAHALAKRGAFIALATHDDIVAPRTLAALKEHGYGPSRYEFQVLLGVREPLWSEWKRAGHTVRVYVPFGSHWRPYSMRRLKKNPQIFRHVVNDTLRAWNPFAAK
jgi:proline dehydrogenase